MPLNTSRSQPARGSTLPEREPGPRKVSPGLPVRSVTQAPATPGSHLAARRIRTNPDESGRTPDERRVTRADRAGPPLDSSTAMRTLSIAPLLLLLAACGEGRID